MHKRAEERKKERGLFKKEEEEGQEVLCTMANYMADWLLYMPCRQWCRASATMNVRLCSNPINMRANRHTQKKGGGKHKGEQVFSSGKSWAVANGRGIWRILWKPILKGYGLIQKRKTIQKNGHESFSGVSRCYYNCYYSTTTAYCYYSIYYIVYTSIDAHSIYNMHIRSLDSCYICASLSSKHMLSVILSLALYTIIDWSSQQWFNESIKANNGSKRRGERIWKRGHYFFCRSIITVTSSPLSDFQEVFFFSSDQCSIQLHFCFVLF